MQKKDRLQVNGIAYLYPSGQVSWKGTLYHTWPLYSTLKYYGTFNSKTKHGLPDY